MVCVDIHLIVALPPFERCVYVCLMFSPSTKLKEADMSGKGLKKKAAFKILRMIGERKGREIKVKVKRN